MVFPIHSRLFASLGSFFPDVAQIQERPNPEGQDAAGQPVTSWSALVGHEAIGCRVAPAGGNERRSVNQVVAQSTHVILLTGAYPDVTARMRVVVDGQAYDILLAETDGNQVMTRLVCEVIDG
jgi:SPP1 family predicted phage head-tail adaptor